MHTSLIAEYRDRYLLTPEPPVCGIIDFHMHVNNGAEDDIYVRIAGEYGVVGACAMLHQATPMQIRGKYSGFFYPIAWLRMPSATESREWIATEVKRITRAAEQGAVALKLRSTCKEGRPSVWIDHPYILEVLAEAARLGLFIYIHIAEPSCWWPQRFDPAVVGAKIEYLYPVETILKCCPELQVVGAHLGGYPEELERLDSMLGIYSNYSLDLSATKWMVRELGRDVAKSRNFIERNQERLYFGSDLVSFLSEGQEDYFRSRLAVLRHLFEQESVIPSMIIDPDALAPDYPAGPEVRGLGLDEKILCKIYRDNALRILGRGVSARR